MTIKWTPEMDTLIGEVSVSEAARRLEVGKESVYRRKKWLKSKEDLIPDGVDPEKLWTSRQLADYVGTTLYNISNAAISGSIPGAYKILGHWYFEKDVTLAEWIPPNQLKPVPVLDGKGGFRKGNVLGTLNTRAGRPSRKVEAKYLQTLSDRVTPEDWMAIIVKAVSQAKDGDWRARQWLSNYLMGKPIQRVEADVSVTTTKVFAEGERAAAVEALLGAARQREERKIVDVEPNVITSTITEPDAD